MLLKGDRLWLRLVEEEDLPLLVVWRNNPLIWRWFFNKFPLSKTGQKDWFLNLNKDASKKLFVICLLENNDPIGTIGLDNIDFLNQSTEIGNILIGEQEYFGKGYGREAVTLLLNFCYWSLNMNRVYLEVIKENTKAVQLYEQCGFLVDGILRDAYYNNGGFQDILMMSLLRREYKSID